MWTKYSENFSDFYGLGILAQQQIPPANSYTVSCLPWIKFDHFAVHSYDNKQYYFPSIEAGKFIQQGNTINMPISITAHHATTDGWHIKLFLEDLQNAMNNPQEWL